MVTGVGVELEKAAIGHEQSTQQSEKWSQVAAYKYAASLFRTAQSLFRSILDHGRW